MSITAFPVLARILRERNLRRSRVGTLAIACAVVDEVTGWGILACITALIRASRSVVPIWLTLTGSLAFAVFMIVVVRPMLKRLEVAGDRAIGMVVSSSWFRATPSSQIHLLFGAASCRRCHASPRLAAGVDGTVLPDCLMHLPLRIHGCSNNGLVRAAVFGLILAVAVAGKWGGRPLRRG